jgi:wyosine [tRNA(Phe)-imidazoG37] synthetase (radical SAM superfamily)
MEKHLASIAESMKAFNESVVTNGPAIVEAMRMANVLAASIPAPNDD